MKKRILAILLVLGMLLTMTPMVFAEEAVVSLKIDDGAEQNYLDFESAVEAIDSDESGSNYTLKLLSDVQLAGSRVEFEGKNVTINLNGHDLKAADGEEALFVKKGGTLTVNGPGKISSNAYNATLRVMGFDEKTETKTTLNINKDVLIEGRVGINVPRFSDGANEKDVNYGTVVNFNGNIQTTVWGIFVNGLNKVTDGSGPILNIGKDAKINAGHQGMGINGYADVTINDGAYIYGKDTGIEIRAGKLKINGGTIIGDGTGTEVVGNTSGSTTKGAGVAIIQHTTKLPIEVTIEKGEIKGFIPIYQSNPQNNEDTDIEKVDIEINGGVFEAINDGENAVYSENKEDFITGGRFIPEQPEDKYVAEGTEFKEDPAKPGEYIVDDGSEEEEPGGDEKPDDEKPDDDDEKPDDDDEKPDDEKPDDKKPSKDKDHSSGSSSSRKTTKKQEPATSDASIQSTVNGKVSLDPKAPKAGDKVTLTVTPDKGYEIDTVQVTDKNGDEVKLTDKGNGKYSFIMPDSKINVLATFKAVEGMKAAATTAFTDVPADAYFADAVKWAVAKGITTGTTETTFSPNASCTRAQMVTFLWRAAGSPEPADPANPFEDIAEDAYYYKAVLWAVEQGITKGVSDTEFAPEDTVTRGQTATFLYRYADAPAVEGENEFTDVPADEYYADAVQWAVDKDVTKGTSETTFSPADDCTRGQIVTFLYRYMAD